jgi:hypothetical protein
LVLEWKQTNAREWAARVVYVPSLSRPRSIEAWFREVYVRPVTVTDFRRGRL